MSYQDKYIKYKKKYIDLKNQLGSGKDKTFSDGVRKLTVIASDNIPLELLVNHIDTKILSQDRQRFLGDRLFYNDIVNIDITSNELDILANLYKQIRPEAVADFNLPDNPVSSSAALPPSDEIDYKLVDNTNIVPYSAIRVDDSINHITSLDLMINLINQRKSYLTDDLMFVESRIKELKEYKGNTKDAIELFNREKNTTRTMYEKIKSLFSDFRNYFMNNLIVEPLVGDSYRRHMGKIIIDSIPYIYKRNSILSTRPKFHSLDEILNLYEFIINCNNAYFNENHQRYSVEFVKIPKIIIYTKEEIGYVMNIVVGSTVRDLIKNDGAYWIEHKELIKKAIYMLIDNLTKRKVLVRDFAYDNIMWDKDTNKLTYIDIMPSAFNRHAELDMNESVKQSVMYDLVY